MEEQDMKEQYMQFQLLQQQMEQISEHIEKLHQHNVEIEDSKEAIKELSKTKLGEVLAPISNGIFIKANLTENQKLLVNVGAGTVVEKTSQDVIDLLEEQQKQLVNKINEAEQILQQLNSQAIQIYQKAEKGNN